MRMHEFKGKVLKARLPGACGVFYETRLLRDADTIIEVEERDGHTLVTFSDHERREVYDSYDDVAALIRGEK